MSKKHHRHPSNTPEPEETQAQRVAIVTGGSRGLGRSIVLRLAVEGYLVHFTYRTNDNAAAAVCDEVGNGNAVAVRCDSTDFDSVRTAVDEAFDGDDREPAVLVNNAGITRDGALMFMDPADWQEVINTNLTGAFNFCRAAAIHFVRRKRGSIICMSSVTGIEGNAGQASYAASKAGVIGLTHALARELSPRGVRVNAVAPGLIDTDMTADQPASRRQAYISRILLGRYGRPEEVAKVVSFLAGDDAAYITNQVIRVDGGLGL